MDNSTLKIKLDQARGMNLFRFFSIVLTLIFIIEAGTKTDSLYVSGGANITRATITTETIDSSYNRTLQAVTAGITRANIDTSHSRHATADSATIPVLKGNVVVRGAVTADSATIPVLKGNVVVRGAVTADSATIPVLKGNVTGNAATATSVNSTNYNSYSTTTSGWSSTSYAYVYWHRIGSVVFVLFSIQGTSNSNIATFTLPYSSIVQANFVCNYQDNGGSYQVGYGYTSGNVVYICAGNWGGDYNAFTPSGNKHVLGSFIYFAK